WTSGRRRIGVQRCRMSPAKMNKTVAAAEDTEGIYKRNKQDEYDFMNSTSPPRSSPEGCSEADENVNDISGENSSVIGGVPSKLTVRETDARPRYGVASVCGRRRDMEDTVSIHPSFVRKQTEFSRTRWHYFGVYDGHGCSHAPRVSARGSLSDKNEEWKKMMERSFTRMDMEAVRWEETVMNANCKCELQTPNCDAVGSTAVVSVITPEKIIVANCGQFFVGIENQFLYLQITRRASDILGSRVLGVLATSRAIGDNYLKPYVSSEPEVTVTERSEEDEFMILASDGLWDVVTNDAACATVQIYLNKKGGRGGGRRREATECEERKEEKVVGSRKNGKRGEITDKACAEASVLLTNLALGKHSSDNVSVVVIDLSRRRKRHVA
ncbi:hypothetical protein HID58_070153, partial [Brassica napus]